MLTTAQITEVMLQERMSLTAFIYATVRNYHLAEDVYQEICVKAMSYAGTFESRRHMLNWFRLSARNKAIDIIRTREGRLVGLSEQAFAALEQQWDADENSVNNESLSALNTCLEHLSPRNKELVRLRYFEGKSGEDIAILFKFKLESAYQALTRVHKTLADCVRQRLEHCDG